MAEYKLFGIAQSGNVYNAALMLTLCEADWEPVFVDFFNGETRSEAFRADNPMGEVPVLVHGDVRLSQTGVILDYLVEKFERFGWQNNDERRDILRWLLWDNHKLTSYTATYRFYKQFTGQGDTPVAEEFRARAFQAYDVLNIHLTGREWVVGTRMTIADISMCGYLFFDDEIGVSWDDYPAIKAWLARIKAQPGWAHPYKLMPGHPLPS